MTALITILVMVASMAFGRWYALKTTSAYLEAAWAKHAREFPILARDRSDKEFYGERHRREAQARMWLYTFTWPIFLPISILSRHDLYAIESRDPIIQQQRIDAQQKHIAKLERELGVGR